MRRTTIFIYGLISYAIFFATFLYAIGFVGNFLVPTTIDGTPNVGLVQALAINLGLLSLFAIQHSVMARPAFKTWWTGFVPKPAERSTYVLFSSLAMILMFHYWQPMGGYIWQVENAAGYWLLYSGFAFGWGLVLVSTFLINHFDLFGLRQVWLELRGREYTPLGFVTPGPYRIVRHPLYLGWLFAFWCTPTMSVAHFLFAAVTTGYILVAIQLEERDLADALPEYDSYRKDVPMIVPGVGSKSGSSKEATAQSV